MIIRPKEKFKKTLCTPPFVRPRIINNLRYRVLNNLAFELKSLFLEYFSSSKIALPYGAKLAPLQQL